MLRHPRVSLAYLPLLATLIVIAVMTGAAFGQGFQAVILDSPHGLDNGEATGISPGGVVSGFGYENGDSSPRHGLRWAPDFNWSTGEDPLMDGTLSSFVFHGVDPDTDWPFGAAVGTDTGNHIHAITMDEIEPDPVLSDTFYGHWTDTHPGGYSESQMLAGASGFRTGYGIPTSGMLPHATLWDLVTGTTYDLHPSGFTTSTGAAMIGTNDSVPTFTVAGWGEQGGLERALTWSFDSFGIPATNLHPTGHDSSRAQGISSRFVVGMASPAGSGTQQAVVFTGNGNAVNLNPSWSSYSQAVGASDSGIVGFSGVSVFGRTALYWSDADPSTVVDLHQFLPADYISSYAVALNDGKFIVGTGVDSAGERHAVVWRPVSTFWLAFPRAVVRAGQLARAMLVLQKPAPRGGLRIKLSPSSGLDALAWSTQAEVLIPEGKTSVAVNVATSDRRPSKPVRATITATWGKEIRQATVTITP